MCCLDTEWWGHGWDVGCRVVQSVLGPFVGGSRRRVEMVSRLGVVCESIPIKIFHGVAKRRSRCHNR